MQSTSQSALHNVPNTQWSPRRLLFLGFIVASLVVPFAAAGASDDVDLIGDVVLEHADDFAGGRKQEFRVLETNRGRFLLEGAAAE